MRQLQASGLANQAAAFGTVYDPAFGAIQALTLDCAGSATERVRVDLDGRAPDGYFSMTAGLNTEGGIFAYFLNVAPGPVTVNVSAEAGGPAIGSEDVVVDAGGLVTILGLGP